MNNDDFFEGIDVPRRPPVQERPPVQQQRPPTQERAMVCQGCGYTFRVSRLRRCRNCGLILCEDCMRKHNCHRHESYSHSSPNTGYRQHYTTHQQNPVNTKKIIMIAVGVAVAIGIIVAILFGTGVIGADPIVGEWESNITILGITGVTFYMDVKNDNTAIITTTNNINGQIDTITGSWRKISDGTYLFGGAEVKLSKNGNSLSMSGDSGIEYLGIERLTITFTRVT